VAPSEGMDIGVVWRRPNQPLGKGPIWPPLIVGIMPSYQFTHLISFVLLVFSHSFVSYVESGLLATE